MASGAGGLAGRSWTRGFGSWLSVAELMEGLEAG